jgi:hypothetical protein
MFLPILRPLVALQVHAPIFAWKISSSTGKVCPTRNLELRPPANKGPNRARTRENRCFHPRIAKDGLRASQELNIAPKRNNRNNPAIFPLFRCPHCPIAADEEADGRADEPSAAQPQPKTREPRMNTDRHGSKRWRGRSAHAVWSVVAGIRVYEYV